MRCCCCGCIRHGRNQEVGGVTTWVQHELWCIDLSIGQVSTIINGCNSALDNDGEGFVRQRDVPYLDHMPCVEYDAIAVRNNVKHILKFTSKGSSPPGCLQRQICWCLPPPSRRLERAQVAACWRCPWSWARAHSGLWGGGGQGARQGPAPGMFASLLVTQERLHCQTCKRERKRETRSKWAIFAAKDPILHIFTSNQSRCRLPCGRMGRKIDWKVRSIDQWIWCVHFLANILMHAHTHTDIACDLE